VLLRVTLAKAILPFAVLQTAAQRPDSAIARLFPAQASGYVTDQTGTVDAGSVQRITDIAERLRAATGAELAVAVLKSIGDRGAVDVAVAIGRAWGVGAKAAIGDPRRNTGLVILLVPRSADDPNSGQVFIAPGQGLEGIITDLQAGRVRDAMLPAFRRGEYGPGLEQGVRQLAGMIARGMGVTDSALTAAAPPPQQAVSRRRELPIRTIIWLLILLFVVGRALLAGGGRGRRRRGPPWIFWGGGGFGGGGLGGGGFGGFGGGGGGGFGGFGGGGGFSGGGAGGRF
jgi:uncharacterized protein